MRVSARRSTPCVLAVAVVATLVVAGSANADQAANERCANRLSIAFIGKTASAELLATVDPKQAIDGLSQSPDFVERFGRFINAEFNTPTAGDEGTSRRTLRTR